MKKRVLVLGGCGNAGIQISRLLLQESDVELVVAGRNISRARQVADELNREFQTDRVSSGRADAANANSLKRAFEDIDIVVVASSTIEYARNVSSSALEAGADYLDLQLSSLPKLAVLNSLREEIEREGRCFITDGGFHPGVPAAMVRYAATKFDTLEVANVSASFQLNWKELEFSGPTDSEFVEELKDFNPVVLRNGEWVKMSMRGLPKFDFGELFGERYCTPIFLEELRSLPDVIPSLRETGFYIAGFNWVTDYIVMPLAFSALKIFRDKAKVPMGKFFMWGLRNFIRPPFAAVLQLEAAGMKGERKGFMHMRLTHDDAYALTAVPVVACLVQYLSGSIRRPGLWFQASLVDPVQFFRDIERLGVEIVVESNILR